MKHVLEVTTEIYSDSGQDNLINNGDVVTMACLMNGIPVLYTRHQIMDVNDPNDWQILHEKSIEAFTYKFKRALQA